MNWQQIIDKYYGEGSDKLKSLLLLHSQSVARKALQIGFSHTELSLDMKFIEEAAMLHDIGIIRCNAPGIYCHGTEPYICHGRIGAEMLRGEGLPRHARVCERHTGAGLTRDDIVSQQLPLPQQDFLPETMEEKLVCYADKFFSKSRPDEEKTLEQAVRSLSKCGDEGVSRFMEWHEMFKTED